MTKHLLSQTVTDQTATGQSTVSDEQATDQTETTAPVQEAILPEQEETQIRAEDLMGARVVGPDGEEIGKVEDLILDENEKITAWLSASAGFSGLAKKKLV
jgi:ribosomal 30S subunit maturation factor RimM